MLMYVSATSGYQPPLKDRTAHLSKDSVLLQDPTQRPRLLVIDSVAAVVSPILGHHQHKQSEHVRLRAVIRLHWTVYAQLQIETYCWGSFPHAFGPYVHGE
jgi:hypothetical protein